MSNPERVMLLIDADNVSIDIMEQAIRLLLNQHGGLHVRRAYCTAESAVKHQAAFKRMAIKPMVNLAAGKNSTDIALAVDAIDLVLAERPDVVVIASSDSDFAPLVQRLREKGCVVRGIGQKGKTGDETQDVYDDFTVLEHHKSESAERPARKTSVRAAARKTASRKSAVPSKAAAKSAPRSAPASAPTAAPAAAPVAVPAAAPAPAAAAEPAARKTPARKKTAARKAAPGADAAADPLADVMADLVAESAAADEVAPPPARPARKTAARKSADGAKAGKATSAPPAPPADPRVDAVLAVLPELAGGQSLALNVAVQRLREAQLLGRNTPSTKFFAALADRFELRPAGKPTQVLLKT